VTGQIFEKKFYQAHALTFGQPEQLTMCTARGGPSASTRQRRRVDAFPQYWGGKPPFDHISIKSSRRDDEALASAGDIES